MDLTQQYQKYRDIGGDPVGDCFRTAIACLLEVDRDEVPHFIQEDQEGKGHWWDAARAYTQARLPGWTLVCLRPIYPVYTNTESSPRRVILTGDSPRGPWYHAVLVSAATGALEWDPYEGGNGVGLPTDVIALTELRATMSTATWGI